MVPPLQSHAPTRALSTSSRKSRRRSTLSSSTAPLKYPIPIPKEKFDRALDLWKAYEFAEFKERNDASTPGIPGARSATAASTTSRAATSVSVSTTGDLAERVDTMMNFNDTSAATGSGANAIAYTGAPVRVPTRKPLSPKARAKAELIRFLGACGTCHARRVKCPWDHHDINSLKIACSRETLGPHTIVQRSRSQRSQSSNTSSSRGSSGTVAPRSPSMAGASQDFTSLLGIGSALNETTTSAAMILELESQATIASGDSMRPSVRTAEINAPSDLESDAFSALVAEQTHNPYGMYTDSQHLLIGKFRRFADETGIYRGQFDCAYLGDCREHFTLAEDLQVHFEGAHFQYQRLNPAHFYFCSECATLHTQRPSSDLRTGVCNKCGRQGSLELWIYGKFLTSAYDHRYYPDQQAVGRMSAQPSSPSRSNPSSESGLSLRRGGTDSDGQRNAGANIDFQRGSYHQGGGAYLQPNHGGHGFGHSQQQYGYPSPSNWYHEACPEHMELWIVPRDQGEKPAGQMSIRKMTGLLVALFFACTYGPDTCAWMAKSTRHGYRVSNLENHLPAFGFMTGMVSFAAYWWVKHIAGRRSREEGWKRNVVCMLPRMVRSANLQCTQVVPETYARGGEYS
ncbi:hypothetical protein BP5796_09626 [Coleophoma crateriformis]|uniref:Uncharacterized protein n=1 Tax=Coleophoma crateriformis TaxID=565419 RepID=A0A3D8QYN0_9HELO|nr:hypothetical protein BP5796_09626 [Coleophoma crateriformis]